MTASISASSLDPLDRADRGEQRVGERALRRRHLRVRHRDRDAAPDRGRRVRHRAHDRADRPSAPCRKPSVLPGHDRDRDGVGARPAASASAPPSAASCGLTAMTMTLASVDRRRIEAHAARRERRDLGGGLRLQHRDLLRDRARARASLPASRRPSCRRRPARACRRSRGVECCVAITVHPASSPAQAGDPVTTAA